MSISSVAPPPVVIVVPSYDATKDPQDSRAKEIEPAYQPPPRPPLPPGQGTRIDQIA